MMSQKAAIEPDRFACLTQVIYYASNDSMPTTPTFEKVGEACRVLGPDQVLEVAVGSSGTPPKRRPKITNLARLRKLIDPDAPYPQARFDCVCQESDDSPSIREFSFGFDPAGYWKFGATLPMSQLQVSSAWFARIGLEAYLELIRAHFALVDKFQPLSGFVDISRRVDTLDGAVFSSTPPPTMPFQRLVEQTRWVQSLQTGGGKLRSIYWGNYLGNEILDQLGGRSFLERYRKEAKCGNGENRVHCWEFTNGVFLSLSIDPAECCSPLRDLEISARDNCDWLIGEFATAGLLS